MSNYVKITDYAAKDALLTGNPSKVVSGTEIGADFDAVATAVATKVDSGGALGTPSSGTLTNCTGLPDMSVVFTQAGTGATTRTGQAKLREIVSVLDFGAVGDGVTSDVSAFQAAIDATTNGTVQVIKVPRGAYAGDMTTLSYGTRVVVFDEEGGVTYPTAAPSTSSATRNNTYRAGDTTRPWLEGRLGIHSGTSQTSQGDFAQFRVDRLADYTGTANSVSSAIRGSTTISNTVGTALQDKHEWAINGQITNNSDYCDAVATSGSATRNSTAAVWAGHFNAIDNTATSIHYTRAIEANIQADGPDTNNRRLIQTIISHNLAASYAGVGVDTQYVGLWIQGGTADLKNGIKITDSPGVVTNGIVISNTGASGYVDDGVHSGRAMDIKGSGTVGIDLSGGTWSLSALRIGLDNPLDLSDNGTSWIAVTTASAGVEIAQGSTVQVKVAAGVQIGTPTGGYKGAGSLNLAAALYSNGVQVVSARDTGWAAMTGSSNKATAYATSTVTLAQLAGRVMALQAALTTHGLLGA